MRDIAAWAGTFANYSLSRRFLVASFPILLVGMLVIGTWVGLQIERSVAYRIGSVTGMYVDSFIAPHVQSLVHSAQLSDDDKKALEDLMVRTPLGDNIAALKIWRPDGTVVFSTEAELIGRSFPISEDLQIALGGDVHSEISDLTKLENEAEARKWSELIETYVPLHANGLGTVIAAAEFYHSTKDLRRDVRQAHLKSWLVVAATAAAMYLLLFGLVCSASKTIDTQRAELHTKVQQLTRLVAQNNALHSRVRRAAARTTALNEALLRRISADLHDGAGQDLSLALMQVESIGEVTMICPQGNQMALATTPEFQSIHAALTAALAELRSVSAGMLLPSIEDLTVCGVVDRAVRDYQLKAGAKVELTALETDLDAPLPVKITLYRLLQESLSNGFRHARNAEQRIVIGRDDDRLLIEVIDSGMGFDTSRAIKPGHLGLPGMAERVEILGGSFELRSDIGVGTTVRASLPLALPDDVA